VLLRRPARLKSGLRREKLPIGLDAPSRPRGRLALTWGTLPAASAAAVVGGTTVGPGPPSAPPIIASGGQNILRSPLLASWPSHFMRTSQVSHISVAHNADPAVDLMRVTWETALARTPACRCHRVPRQQCRRADATPRGSAVANFDRVAVAGLKWEREAAQQIPASSCFALQSKP